MPNIYSNLTELIGETPMISIERFAKSKGVKANILAKVEYFNPGGSAKDRIALAMIRDAEMSGKLRQGGTIIEPTSGNTGIGLAWIASILGYKVILTMPETMSAERKKILRGLGAELVLTPGSQGMAGAIRRADELCREIPGSVIMNQFDNPANPQAHAMTTAREIWRDTDGMVDALIAGVGTGGTLCGTSHTLKSLKPSLWTVAVEPAGSPVLSGGQSGPHKIQGIGAGMIPGNYDASLVDIVIPITDDQALDTAREVALTEGLLVGISSGAALAAAVDLGSRPGFENKNIVVVLPDTGERYLSTELFSTADED